MPHTAPAPAPSLRDAIDFESEYVVQVRDGTIWSRPETAEHRVLHGIDVWHAIRRAPRYTAATQVGEHGILTLASATAAMRFIPAETAGEDELPRDTGTPPGALPAPAADPTPTAAPYSAADLRTAAATVHHMLLLALDSQSGIGESIGDHPIPATASARTWQSLGNEEASTAYRAIRQLLDDAPDLARRAIDMADEHLVPELEALTRWQDDTATVRRPPRRRPRHRRARHRRPRHRRPRHRRAAHRDPRRAAPGPAHRFLTTPRPPHQPPPRSLQ